MTIDEIKQLDDNELFKVSLQRHKRGINKGEYTWDAKMAYAERQRRAGASGTLGMWKKKPGKFQADLDYYGYDNSVWYN